MANSKVNMIKKAFVRYARERYPQEADAILRRAEELYPVFHAKAPDIGGAENLMAYNLDMFILAIAFYEASDHRMDGAAIRDIARDMARRYGAVRKLVNLNRPWQMKLFRSILYKRYTPYAQLVEEKKGKGEWGNTWRVRVNPRNTDEGLCFDLVGCPLADYAKTNGYEDLLPYMCASDHVLAELMHAKLIRTHTCATGIRGNGLRDHCMLHRIEHHALIILRGRSEY